MSQWSLEEFNKHSKRLERAATAIGTANQAALDTQNDNAAAFGLLFGGVVGGILSGVCGDFSELTSSVEGAVTATSENVTLARLSYEATEEANTAITQVVTVDVESGPTVA